MSKRTAPLSLRLTPEMKRRLLEAAQRTKLSAHALAQMALEAGVEAIERHDGLVVRQEFDLVPRRVPIGRGHYLPHVPSFSTAEDSLRTGASALAPGTEGQAPPDGGRVQTPSREVGTDTLHKAEAISKSKGGHGHGHGGGAPKGR